MQVFKCKCYWWCNRRTNVLPSVLTRQRVVQPKLLTDFNEFIPDTMNILLLFSVLLLICRQTYFTILQKTENNSLDIGYQITLKCSVYHAVDFLCSRFLLILTSIQLESNLSWSQSCFFGDQRMPVRGIYNGKYIYKWLLPYLLKPVRHAEVFHRLLNFL